MGKKKSIFCQSLVAIQLQQLLVVVVTAMRYVPQFVSSLPSEHILIPSHRNEEEGRHRPSHRNWVARQPIGTMCAAQN